MAVGHYSRGGDETTWLRVALWGRRGEAVAQYLTRGKRVAVTGELRVREYETRDGSRGTAVEIRASDVALIEPRGDGGRSGGRGPRQDFGGSAPTDFPDDGFGDDAIPFATAADVRRPWRRMPWEGRR
jgi:single-strand DNA-binding protein